MAKEELEERLKDIEEVKLIVIYEKSAAEAAEKAQIMVNLEMAARGSCIQENRDTLKRLEEELGHATGICKEVAREKDYHEARAAALELYVKRLQVEVRELRRAASEAQATLEHQIASHLQVMENLKASHEKEKLEIRTVAAEEQAKARLAENRFQEDMKIALTRGTLEREALQEDIQKLQAETARSMEQELLSRLRAETASISIQSAQAHVHEFVRECRCLASEARHLHSDLTMLLDSQLETERCLLLGISLEAGFLLTRISSAKDDVVDVMESFSAQYASYLSECDRTHTWHLEDAAKGKETLQHCSEIECVLKQPLTSAVECEELRAYIRKLSDEFTRESTTNAALEIAMESLRDETAILRAETERLQYELLGATEKTELMKQQITEWQLIDEARQHLITLMESAAETTCRERDALQIDLETRQEMGRRRVDERAMLEQAKHYAVQIGLGVVAIQEDLSLLMTSNEHLALKSVWQAWRSFEFSFESTPSPPPTKTFGQTEHTHASYIAHKTKDVPIESSELHGKIDYTSMTQTECLRELPWRVSGVREDVSSLRLMPMPSATESAFPDRPQDPKCLHQHFKQFYQHLHQQLPKLEQQVLDLTAENVRLMGSHFCVGSSVKPLWSVEKGSPSGRGLQVELELQESLEEANMARTELLETVQLQREEIIRLHQHLSVIAHLGGVSEESRDVMPQDSLYADDRLEDTCYELEQSLRARDDLLSTVKMQEEEILRLNGETVRDKEAQNQLEHRLATSRKYAHDMQEAERAMRKRLDETSMLVHRKESDILEEKARTSEVKRKNEQCEIAIRQMSIELEDKTTAIQDKDMVILRQVIFLVCLHMFTLCASHASLFACGWMCPLTSEALDCCRETS